MSPNSSNMRATKLKNTKIVTEKSTRNGEVIRRIVAAAMDRLRIVSVNVIAYCSKYRKVFEMAYTGSVVLACKSSRKVSIASRWSIELVVAFMKTISREATNLLLSLEKRKSCVK